MSILLKNEIEGFNLSNNSCFLSLLKELNNLHKKRQDLEENTKEICFLKDEALMKKCELIKKQKEIHKEICVLLSQKEEIYDETIFNFDKKINSKLSEKIDVLVNHQKSNDFKISQLYLKIKLLEKNIEDNNTQKSIIDNNISICTKEFFKEYIKINWNEFNGLKQTDFNFDKIKDNELKKVLMEITKKNIEFEKIIVSIIYKYSNQIIKNEDIKNLNFLINNIEPLIEMKNRVYALIYKIILIKHIKKQTTKVLELLFLLMNNICNISKHMINNKNIDKKLDDIFDIIEKLKLDNEVLLKKHHNIFISKEQVEFLNESYDTLDKIMELTDSYLLNFTENDNIKHKVYRIN